MTREKAIKELTELLPEEFLMEYAEAIRMGIEALKQEPCDDCISRQAVIDTIDKWVKSMHVLISLPANEVTPLFENVHNLLSVTPQKIGHWIEHIHNGMHYIECSKCSSWFLRMYLIQNSYCPNCGAKMSEIPIGAESEDKK